MLTIELVENRKKRLGKVYPRYCVIVNGSYACGGDTKKEALELFCGDNNGLWCMRWMAKEFLRHPLKAYKLLAAENEYADGQRPLAGLSVPYHAKEIK